MKHKIMLAPLEDVTDIAFRLTCKKYGADIVFTEMVHTRSAVRGLMPKISEKERPLAVQVAGENEKEVIKTAKEIQDKCDFIDINLGCPGWNVIRSGYGSVLLKEPKKIAHLVSTLKANVRKPVTAKIRAGFETNNAVQIAKTIEKAGADMITVHPRTVKQGYSGKADWNIIKAVKEAVRIPVTGNGDVRTGKDTAEMLKIADNVMIGRAAIGNPLVFKRVKDYLKKGKEEESSAEEKIKAFETYLRYARKHDLLEKTKVLRYAQQATKTIPGAASFRHGLSKLQTEEIAEKTKEFLSTK